MSGDPQRAPGLLVDLQVLEPGDTPHAVTSPRAPVPGTWKTVIIPLLQAVPRYDGPNGLHALCMTKREPPARQPHLVIFTSKNAVATVDKETELFPHWAAGIVRCAAVGTGTHHALQSVCPAFAAEDRLLPVCAEPGVDPVLRRYISPNPPRSASPVFVLGTPGGASENIVSRWKSTGPIGREIWFYGVYALAQHPQGARELRELCAANENQGGLLNPPPLILHCRSGTVVRAAAQVLSEGKLKPVPFSVWGASARAAALELGLPIWPLS